MDIGNIITLLGGVALFLFGMGFMGDSLKKVAGNKLELILYKLSSTPLKGILLGTGVTAVIQSSSATSVMVVGFVNSGMMKVRQAIGIVMGAILGTSITGWIICLSSLSGGSGWVSLLSTSTLTGVIAVIGILLRMAGKKQSTIHVGNILLGFAVLMFGMSAMSDAVAPLKESAAFVSLLTKFSNPLLGILVGIAFTSVLQSASAAVGILQALAITGAITFDVAFPIVLGIAIGAAVPVLLSSLGANVDGKRAAWSYLVISVIGVIVCGAAYYVLQMFIDFPFAHTVMTTVSIAMLNTLFRLVNVIILAPFFQATERLCCLIIPDKAMHQPADMDMDRLEERFLAHPALAIEQCRLVTNSMAENAQKNILDAISLRSQFSESGFQAVADLEETLDRYEDKLGTYLMKITAKSLTTDQSEAVSKYLHNISDFERISDHALNIAEAAREIKNKNIYFSEDGTRELAVMEGAVTEILYLAMDAFINGNMLSANRIEPLEEIIDGLCDEMKLHHIDRLKKGQCTYDHGFVFNDLVTNYERVADHCSNIGVAMIELESDDFDTHEYLNSVKEMKSESFAKYYDEYRRRFSL